MSRGREEKVCTKRTRDLVLLKAAQIIKTQPVMLNQHPTFAQAACISIASEQVENAFPGQSLNWVGSCGL